MTRLSSPPLSRLLRGLPRPAALGAALLLALAPGCSPGLPDPAVKAVHPAWGFNGEDTPIEIEGTSFYPQVSVTRADGGSVDRDFRVFLETDPLTELQDVQVVDYRHLSAVVPAGLDVGSYSLQVRSPTGATGALDAAFDVRDSRADQLRATPANGQLSWRVLEYASVTIELIDPDGQRVPQDLGIKVSIDGADSDHINFQADTLQDQRDLSDAVGIQGQLGPDGVASIALTSTVPAEAVVLHIDPMESSSAIGGTVQLLSFTPGDVAGVRVDLPSAVFDTTAGQPFDIDVSVVDVGGNVVDDADTLLVLREACTGGTLAATTSFVGQTTLTVTATRATEDGCASNAVVAYGLSTGTYVEGSSDGFAVAPGPGHALSLEVWPSAVVAGQDELLTALTAIDAWDNRATEVTGPVSLRASADGGDFVAPSWYSCYDLVQGETYCRAILDQAGRSVVLLGATQGPGALTGISSPFTVTAGTAVALLTAVRSDPVVAGQPFEVALQALDELGNAVLLDPLGADPASIEDSDGDVGCDWDHDEGDGQVQVYACTATLAHTARQLQVSLPSRGLSVETDPVDVINGPLALARLSLGASSVQAGSLLAVQLDATDAWGNPYLVQDDPVVELSDDTGSLSPSSISLGASGGVTFSAVITTATPADHLVASQGGVLLGTSAAVEVRPGAVFSLDLSAPRTFAWLAQDLPVTVRALDRYGNVATTDTGAVSLSSEGGLGPAVAIAALTAGQATVSFRYASAGLNDRLLASDGVRSAALDLDALDEACASPPTASLVADGTSPAVLCRLATGRTRTVTLSAAASTAGTGSLAHYHLQDEDGSWTVATSPTWSRAWSDEGGRTMSVVVADTAACADLAELRVYVGDDDGLPTGPVSLSLASSTLRAGSAGSVGHTTASVSATTCAGDPAAGATLLVQADLGDIDTSAGGVSATGKGLAVALDSSGDGSLTWTMASERYAGTATLRVGRTGAIAYGETQATVLVDSARPRVVGAVPAGTTTELFDRLEIDLTESLYAPSISASAIHLLDPTGAEVALSSSDVSLSDRRLLVSLPATQDAGTGEWSLQLDSTLRDQDGNRLDGAWLDAATPFLLPFGATPDLAPDLSACSYSTGLFRPDGDPGTGEEADELQIDLAATATPAWWRLQVIDAAGSTVRTMWTPEGSASTATLSWDGRGDDGRVDANGSYLVSVTPADDAWNLGSGCDNAVTLDNRVAAP